MMYQSIDEFTVKRTEDNILIPLVPGNRHFAEYQEWLNAGNTPESAPSPPPAPDYTTFWEGLMASSIYSTIREQSMASLPMNTLGTEFIALLGDAKAGRPYEAAIQQSMLAILSTGTFTEEQITELELVLEASNLDSIYTLTPPTP